MKNIQTITLATFYISSSIGAQDSVLQTQSSSNPSPPPSLSYKKSAFIYDFDFSFLFDNLEKSDPFWKTRTLAAASLAPEIGIEFFGQQIKFGGFFTLNMGEEHPKQWGMTLFYNFKAKDFSGSFGIFSKKDRIGSYSSMFFRQDYDFFHPLINGVMLQYSSPKTASLFQLDAELIFDWYNGDLIKRIDEFLIQGSIKQSFWQEKLYWGGSFVLYHTKNSELLNLDGHNFDTFLLDHLYYQVYIGSNLTSMIPEIQKLNFQIGTLSSLERKRRLSSGLDPFSNQLGWQFESEIAYFGFGINNALYWGNSQYKYYHQYGERIYNGIPFFQSRLYNRTEFYYEYKNEYLKTRASFILHATPKGLANQQMITLVVDTAKVLSLIF